MLPAPPGPPFVKVCGFTDAANLRAVCEADVRPDAVGLNFWRGSKRFVWAAFEPTRASAGYGSTPRRRSGRKISPQRCVGGSS